MSDILREPCMDCFRKDAEIERLKALVREISATRDTAVNMKLKCNAENERMRQTINDQAQEIERLTRPC